MKKCCWLPYFKSVNCIYRFWDMSCMQLLYYRNFIKSQVWKRKIDILVFSKQHGLASKDSLVVRSIGWGFVTPEIYLSRFQRVLGYFAGIN